MARDDWIRVAIRIFGIYLIVLAIVGIPGLISAGFQTWSWFGMRDDFKMGSSVEAAGVDVGDVFDDIRTQLGVNAISAAIGGLVRLLLFLFFGVYFLRSGRLIFRLVRPPVEALSNRLSDTADQED